jgi:hypothetical protein
VNIKVNIVVWLVEFLGCMTMAIDFLVIGSRSNAITGLLKLLTMLVYFIVLPSTFLVNCSAGINTIVDENWLTAITRIVNPIPKKDEKKSPRSRAPLKKVNKVKPSSIFIISKEVVDISTVTRNITRRKSKLQLRGTNNAII